MTTLYITEKPSQAKEVAEALGITKKTDGAYRGAGVIVTNAVGHVMEQAEPEAYGEQYKTWKLDTLPILPNPWQIVVKDSARAQYKIIKDLLKQANDVVIATDADREGEVIAREILDHVGYKGAIKRLWVQETTPSGYKKGMQNLKNGSEYRTMYESGLGRSRADWLSGMNLTRALTTAFSTGGKGNTLHFGRVQTPTLALIVMRERAIANFKPSDYYNIKAHVNFNGSVVKMNLKNPDRWLDKDGRIPDENTALDIIMYCSGHDDKFKVTKYETTEERDLPPLPYYLGSLQKECSTRLGLRPDKVLEICQTLYDTYKLVSYPRGEGEHIPEQIFEESKERLNALASIDPSIKALCDMADLSKPSRAFNDKQVAKSGSHFAIIPTDNADFDISRMKPDEKAVYDLIRRRYIAQFLGNYIFDKTIIEISNDAPDGVTFAVSGNTPKIQGWKRAYTADKAKDQEDNGVLPKTQQGASVQFAAPFFSADLAKTKAPPRYTNASLITAMESIDKEIEDERLAAVMKGKEKAGIGTNATRSDVIAKLYDGGYIADLKKNIVPTEKGVAIIQLLERVAPELVDLALTAMWEDNLAQVESGEIPLEKFDKAIGRFVTACIEKIKAAAGSITIGTIAFPCPSCGKALQRRKNEKGYWWGCSGYPTCKQTMLDVKGKPTAIPQGKSVPKPAQFSEYKCEKCSKPLIRRKGAKGFWWGCSGFPTCREIYQDKQGKPTKKT